MSILLSNIVKILLYVVNIQLMKLQLNVFRKINQFTLTAVIFQTTKSLSIEKHGKLYAFSRAVAISGNPWLVLRTIQYPLFQESQAEMKM
jgi:hypothetical protein